VSLTYSADVDVDVDDSDIIDHIAAHPRLMVDALRALAKPPEKWSRRLDVPRAAYGIAVEIISGADACTLPIDQARAWAQQFEGFDAIDRQRALVELDRVLAGLGLGRVAA
jgi:hypothetical protein